MSPIHSNQYELLDKIAKGGMAEVYRARKLGVRNYDSLVAVKRILPERAEETSFVEMLIDEARITSQLKHPNIAQLYELACDETGYFIVMELLLGPNFAALIDKLKIQGRHLPQACAVEVIIQLLKALDYAHNKCDASGHPLHLVHRDISPDNLLLGPNGDVKLIDFGVAKAKDRLADKTKAGMIKGKFSYLAPERLRSSVSDPRSDLFSAALVLWEALAGRIRFDAEDDRDLIEQIEANSSPSFREMGIEIAPQLENILNRALKTRPEERYQTAGEFLDALVRYQRRFNPGDNQELLGKLVSSSFKSELRWLDEAIQKFKTGRLRPLGVIGGGIVEERFQLSKRSTSAQRATSYQLKRPSSRRPNTSPFEEVPCLDSPVERVETSVFRDHGIEILGEEDFEEDTGGSWNDGVQPVRAAALGPSRDAPKTEISPPPAASGGGRRPGAVQISSDARNHEKTRDREFLPLGASKNEQRTKTRVFNFGEGASFRLTFDPKKAAVVLAALIFGVLIFVGVTRFIGSGGIPEPPAIDTAVKPRVIPPSGPVVVVPPAPAPQTAPAAQPLPQTPPPGPTPLVPPSEASQAAAVPPASPSAEANTANAAAAPSAPAASVQKPASKKKKKRKPVKKRRRQPPKKKKRAPIKKAAPAVEDDDSFDEDEDDDSFFISDDLTDTDDGDDEDESADSDDSEEEAPAPRSKGKNKAQSAQSAADEAFDGD